MENIDSARGLVFQALEDDLNYATIYLLKRLGIDLGFSFQWEGTKIYSPVLSDYMRDNIDRLLATNFSNSELSSNTENAINRIKTLGNSNKDLRLSREVFYHLAAELLLLSDDKSIHTKAELVDTAIKLNKSVSKEQCYKMFDILNRNFNIGGYL